MRKKYVCTFCRKFLFYEEDYQEIIISSCEFHPEQIVDYEYSIEEEDAISEYQ